MCDLCLQEQVCNDVAKRLRLLEDSWKGGKLSLPVRRRMDTLSQGNLTVPVCLPEPLCVSAHLFVPLSVSQSYSLATGTQQIRSISL